jgi:uncharacterized glyoxalase superfamily protein PhnB
VDDFRNTITPVLTLRDAVRAVACYERAFGAQEIYRTPTQTVESLRRWPSGPARFRVADEAPEAAKHAVAQGDHVRINLLVADPDAVAFAGSALPRRHTLCFLPAGAVRDAS